MEIYNYNNNNLNYNNDDLYRNCLLKSLNLSEFNEKIINSKINKIFNILINEDKFKMLFKISANSLLFDDLEIGMMQLFSYHYFKDWHIILSQFLKNKEINEKLINLLIERFSRK